MLAFISWRRRFSAALAAMRPPPPAAVLVIVFVAVGLLVSLPVSAQAPSFSISIHDDRFEPNELQVPAGQKIERAAASEFESAELRREKVVPAGEQVTVYVGPLRPGTYDHPAVRGHLVAR
jgi:Cupredoxin-like domain